jgi:uncharacterized membrane protein YhaH (DUF805 family)
VEKILALSAYFSFWRFVEIGFLRGTACENYYGPEPLTQGCPADLARA